MRAIRLIVLVLLLAGASAAWATEIKVPYKVVGGKIHVFGHVLVAEFPLPDNPMEREEKGVYISFDESPDGRWIVIKALIHKNSLDAWVYDRKIKARPARVTQGGAATAHPVDWRYFDRGLGEIHYQTYSVDSSVLFALDDPAVQTSIQNMVFDGYFVYSRLADGNFCLGSSGLFNIIELGDFCGDFRTFPEFYKKAKIETLITLPEGVQSLKGKIEGQKLTVTYTVRTDSGRKTVQKELYPELLKAPREKPVPVTEEMDRPYRAEKADIPYKVKEGKIYALGQVFTHKNRLRPSLRKNPKYKRSALFFKSPDGRWIAVVSDIKPIIWRTEIWLYDSHTKVEPAQLVTQGLGLAWLGPKWHTSEILELRWAAWILGDRWSWFLNVNQPERKIRMDNVLYYDGKRDLYVRLSDPFNKKLDPKNQLLEVGRIFAAEPEVERFPIPMDVKAWNGRIIAIKKIRIEGETLIVPHRNDDGTLVESRFSPKLLRNIRLIR